MSCARKWRGMYCHLKQEAAGNEDSWKVASRKDMDATKAEMGSMGAVALEETI